MFKVESADQHRKLLAHINGVLDWEMVPDGMQDAAKRKVSFPVIGPVQFLHQVLKPDVSALNCGVEHVEAGEFHTARLAR